jgi:tetratricopeptide (TPR) repeat protein
MVFSTFWLEHKIGLWARGKDLDVDYEKLKPDNREFHAGDFHLTNMVIHAINSALVVWLLRGLGVTPWVAWFVAGLFALHPINVASVSWASELKNVLSGLFALLSLALYLRDTRRNSWTAYGFCLLFYVMALLSKTAMVTLPVTALLCDRLITGRWLRRSLARVAPMLVLALVAATVTAFNEKASAKETMIALDLPLRPFAAAGALWFYIWKIFVPLHFPGVYSRWDLAGANLQFIAALVTLPATTVLVWKLRRRLPGQVSWALVYYVISLGPMLGLISFNYTQFTFVADHFVYLASIGIFLCVALAVHWLGRRLVGGRYGLPLVTVLACAVLVALGYRSYHHNQTVWQSGKTFWQYTLKYNPTCWPGHYNLANIYRREWDARRREGIRIPERLKQAAEHYGLAAKARTDLHQAHRNRGETLAMLGDYDGAIESYRTALDQRPRSPGYWSQLAGVYERAKRLDDAEEAWREAIKLVPRKVHYGAGLARVLETQQKWEEAQEAWRAIIKLAPTNAPYHAGLARALEGRQVWDQAEASWRRAIELKPNDPNLHYRLGRLLNARGRLVEAIAEYDQALQFKPNHQAARRGLVAAEQILQQRGD